MTIFNDLENALASYVGGGDAAGMILGLSVIVAAMFGFTIAFGKEFLRGTNGLVILIAFIGIVSAPGVDWFPIWIPFLVVVSLLLVYWLKGFESLTPGRGG